MKIDIEVGEFPDPMKTRVGNVYAVRGGRGARFGHMQVVVGISDPPNCFNDSVVSMITVNKQGDIVGASSYALNYIEGKQPIAFVDGLDELTLRMRSL